MNSYCSVDGIHFQICEPSPFDPKWYSHKFKGPGLRYEIALCIDETNFVWYNGPFPCGSNPDLKIYKNGLKELLKENEKVISDGGYQDRSCVRKVHCTSQELKTHKRIRARHETSNRRLRHFNILRHRFRHQPHKHGMVFRAIINIVQLEMTLERPLFEV